MRACLMLAATAGWLAGGCGSDARQAPTDAGMVDAGVDAPPPPPPPAEPGRHTVEVVETRRVVPSPGLPADLPAAGANNNLDIVRHADGRVYLAWRNAPDHFASTSVVINVASSADETSWQREASFSQGTDLREPRFLSWGGTLFLYVSLLGSEGLSFEPRGVARAEKPAAGAAAGAGFSPLEDLGWPPYIVWRTRVELGRPYLLRYLGGQHIYAFDGQPLTVELLTSSDGRDWSPAAAGQPVIWTGGGSETDFAQTADATLYGIIRNEGGDDDGWGSKVCRTSGTDVAPWTCRHDARRFDSPLVFAHDGEIYVVARRNVTADGSFDLGSSEPDRKTRVISYHLDYLTKPKRCAIWRFVPGEDRVAFVIDLPSRGDTCFPGRIAGDDADTHIIYDYSSDLDGPDLSWNQGQNGSTYIYRHTVRFTPRP